MPDPTETSVLDHLPCVGCKYDLTGLHMDGVCPECTHSIGDSIARRKRPWRASLRLLRTAYFTAWMTIIAAPFAVPPIGRLLGLPVNMTRRGMFSEVLAWCIAPTVMVGLVLLVSLARRQHWLTGLVALSIGTLCLWILPALGQ